jgi:hypothetical protein
MAKMGKIYRVLGNIQLKGEKVITLRWTLSNYVVRLRDGWNL